MYPVNLVQSRGVDDQAVDDKTEIFQDSTEQSAKCIITSAMASRFGRHFSSAQLTDKTIYVGAHFKATR